MEEIINKFKSKKNGVYLIKNEQKIFVRKIFLRADRYYQEINAMQVLQTHNIPQIIKHGNFYIDMEYLEGNLFLDEFLSANQEKMIFLAKILVDYIKNYINIRQNVVPCDMNFRNFIIKNQVCYGVDFEECAEGDISLCIAKAAAFAGLYDIEENKKQTFCTALIEEAGLKDCNMQLLISQETEFLKNRRGKGLLK